MNIRSSLLLGSILLALGLVTGCSGGGSSGPDTGPSGISTSNATGTVADGIIRQGQVIVNELDASGKFLRKVGNTTTDNQGQYSVTIDSSYGGGPLQFKLTGNANTTMVCDVATGCGTRTDTLADPNNNGTVDFGEVMSANSLSMEALIGHANAGDTLSVSITPFTTAAANRARNAGTLDQAAVDSANSSISNLLGGLDIIRQTPLDLTDPAAVSATSTTETQITYSALVASIGALAFTSGSADVDSLQTAIGKLNTAMAGADIGAVTAAAGAYSLQDIVNAAKGQFPAGHSDQTGALTAMQATINLALGNGSGSVGIQPNPNASDTDIAKAKALVSEIRTWGVSLDSASGPAGSFYNTVRKADSVGDFRQFSSLSDALNIMTTIALDPTSNGGDADNKYTGTGYGTTGTGNVSYHVSGSTIFAKIVGQVGENTVDLDATFPAPGNTTQTSAKATISGSVASTSLNTNGPGASLTINSGTFNVSYSPAHDPYTFNIGGFKRSIDTADLSLDLTFEQQNVTDPVTYTGTAKISAKNFGSSTDDAIIPTSIALDGTVSDTSDSFHVTLDGTLNDTSHFDPLNPDKSVSNAWDGTVTLVMTLDLTGLPQAQVTVSVHHTGYDPSTSKELGTANLILSHGGNTLTATATQDAIGTLSQLIFRDTDGATLTMSYANDNTTGALTVGTATVGIVSSLNRHIIKVTYSDGTFETLN